MSVEVQNAFAALADPSRRGIVELLARRGQLPVSDIVSEFSITPPAISQHLKVLREAGVVNVRRVAQSRIYSINAEGMAPMDDWLQNIRALWTKRLDSLDSYVTALHAQEKKNAKGKRKRKPKR